MELQLENKTRNLFVATNVHDNAHLFDKKTTT